MSVTLTLGPVARGRNGVIGVQGALPWRLGSDLALFKRLTLGKPMIMGRKTWESLPLRPLPGRLNIVLSRDGTFQPKGAVVCDSFAEAVGIGRDQAAEDGVDEVCVIGGAALFALALPKARRLYLTEVDAAPEGDVVFPPLDESAWREVRREAFDPGPRDDHAFIFRELERV
ncbi:MAG: dihydrofolate reductase [Alphaproteobacteria bacterium]|nr:dihydrofolate reductase [Alphaproteobacteria bacterium]